MRRSWRVVSLVLVVLLPLTGMACVGRPPEEAGAAGPTPQPGEVVVPFLLVVPKPVSGDGAGGAGLAKTLWIGRWEVGRGTVSFDPRPLCSTQCSQVPGTPEWKCASAMAWDGGKRFVINASCVNATFAVSGVHPDYRVEAVEPPVSLGFMALRVLADGSVAALGQSGAGFQMEVVRGEKRTSQALQPPFPLAIPLGLFATGKTVLGVMGSETVLDGGAKQYRIGLVEFDPGAAAKPLGWREVVVDPGLSPDISGPGAVMVKGRVYLPASGRVGVVDPATWRLEAFAPADRATQAWRQAADPSYLFTALGAMGDVLLVRHLSIVGGSEVAAVWALRDDGTVLGRLEVTAQGVRCLAGDAASGPATGGAQAPAPSLVPLPAAVEHPSVLLSGSHQF